MTFDDTGSNSSRPIVMTHRDIEALAHRLENHIPMVVSNPPLTKDLRLAARLARHVARTWVIKTSISVA